MKLIPLPDLPPTLHNLAKIYRTTVIAVKKFQSQHERIFTEYAGLTEAMAVAENELKTKAKTLAVSYEDEGIVVEYAMPKHRYLDPKIVRKMVPKNILDSLNVIVSKEEVDEKALKALVKLGRVKEAVLVKALVEQPTNAPRVTIKIKD